MEEEATGRQRVGRPTYSGGPLSVPASPAKRVRLKTTSGITHHWPGSLASPAPLWGRNAHAQTFAERHALAFHADAHTLTSKALAALERTRFFFFFFLFFSLQYAVYNGTHSMAHAVWGGGRGQWEWGTERHARTQST